MRLNTLVWAGMAAASLCAVAATAQPSGPPGMRGRRFMDDGAMRAIGAMLHTDGISEDQQAALHATLESDRAAVEPLLDQLRAANESLVDQVLATDAPSADTLKGLVDHIAELRAQLLQRQVQTALSLRDMLGPEQLQQAAQRTQQFGDARDVVFFEKR